MKTRLKAEYSCRALSCLAVLTALLLGGCALAPPRAMPAEQVAANEAIAPPWQHGANNDALDKGFEFTVPPVDVLADFHGSIDQPALVLYVAGNYYFALAPLVAEFGREHPEYLGKVYYETLPPGILVKQMKAGGTITSGNMTWTAKPDLYLAGLRNVRGLIKDGLLTGAALAYVTNDLTIMVHAGNPAHIAALNDLGRPDIRLVMPNPEFEGVARQIKASLAKAGGDALVASVYDAKVKDGTAILTHVHHRQTPLFLMQDLADAGVTWTSEAIFQEQTGHPITHVTIPSAQNMTAIYAAALVNGARHVRAARAWLAFIRSEPALEIFERYGFKPYNP